jgi:hypothetical protein
MLGFSPGSRNSKSTENDKIPLMILVIVILPENLTIGLVKNETIKLTMTYETNTTKIHC